MKLRGIVLVALMSFSQLVLAFNSNDEQIDYVLGVVDTGSQAQKFKVLKRLQWSTISDPRLYDTFEKALLDHYQDSNLDGDLAKVLSYEARALGYSGNPKYQKTLKLLSDQNGNSRIRRSASKALKDFPNFHSVQQEFAKVSEEHNDWPSELQNYGRLLKTNHSYSQRLAARAMFHEQQTQPELVALIAEQLKQNYLSPDLDKLRQDTLAWYCKVLRAAGGYQDLLTEIADKSPYSKIQKYAAKK